MFCASILRLIISAAAFAFFFASCTEKAAEISATAEPVQSADIWEGKKSTLLVLAGQDFPEESGIADFVSWEYGLAEEKGRARFLYWPHTFEERDASLRLLSNTAQEESPEIVVAFAAPEGTLRELNRIRAEFPEIKIVSIFPSDEALPIEAVSDMVIDMDISDVEGAGIDGGITAEEETALDITAREAAALILGAVFSMEMEEMEAGSSGAPVRALLETGMRFAEAVAMSADADFTGLCWEYAQAVDPDTGLRSRKHVLIRKIKEDER